MPQWVVGQYSTRGEVVLQAWLNTYALAALDRQGIPLTADQLAYINNVQAHSDRILAARQEEMHMHVHGLRALPEPTSHPPTRARRQAASRPQRIGDLDRQRRTRGL
jgi:hypothetical protein